MKYSKQEAARVRGWVRKQLQYVVRYGTTAGEVAAARDLANQLGITVQPSRANYHNRFRRGSRAVDAA